MYSDGSGRGVANARQLQGKELSSTTLLTLQAAWDLAQEFSEPVCAISNTQIPVRDGTAETLAEAFGKALECDPVSAFGGVIGVNARWMQRLPRKWPSSSWKLSQRLVLTMPPRLSLRPRRIFVWSTCCAPLRSWVLKNVSGGFLRRTRTAISSRKLICRWLTKREPTAEKNGLAVCLEGVQAR